MSVAAYTLMSSLPGGQLFVSLMVHGVSSSSPPARPARLARLSTWELAEIEVCMPESLATSSSVPTAGLPRSCFAEIYMQKPEGTPIYPSAASPCFRLRSAAIAYFLHIQFRNQTPFSGRCEALFLLGELTPNGSRCSAHVARSNGQARQ